MTTLDSVSDARLSPLAVEVKLTLHRLWTRCGRHALIRSGA
jgi:hypothetical protein